MSQPLEDQITAGRDGADNRLGLSLGMGFAVLGCAAGPFRPGSRRGAELSRPGVTVKPTDPKSTSNPYAEAGKTRGLLGH
jgi:hypothetical protein